MATASLKPLPPKDAVAYLKARGADLAPSFDWRDVWQQAHATAFTVAKSAGFDILKDVSDAVVQAKEQGLDFEDFQTQLTPILQAKGWWGRKEVTDTVTGEKVQAQLGSPRRLKIIYDTNMRMAHAAGTWAMIERGKDRRPYLKYIAILDGKTRPMHRKWYRAPTILPWDHPWWKTHFPPNGWHCRCSVQTLSEANMKEFGYQVSESPHEDMIPWTNDRTGEVVMTPKGVDPGFGYNPGQVAIEENAARALMGKLVDAPPNLAAAQAASARFVLPAIKSDLSEWITKIGQAVEDGKPQVTGDRRVVGALSDGVLSYLDDHDIEPASGAITISDKDITHAYRQAKRARGDNLRLPQLSALPDVFAAPKAVLWDKRHPGLLYLQELPDKVGKVVVQMDYSTKAKGQGIKTNTFRTGKIIQDISEFRNKGLYELIEGEL